MNDCRRNINYNLRSLFQILSSDEILNYCKVYGQDRLILRGFWIEFKTRRRIAKDLKVSPSYVSRRYNTVIRKIHNKISDLAIENADLKEKLTIAEKLKNESIAFHVKQTGKYPDFMLRRDSIEEVHMSTRLYNCLKRFDIRRIRQLSKHTRQDLFNIKYFGETLMSELDGIMSNFGVKFREDNL